MPITTEQILHAYSQGAFPMADADGVIRWYTANPRGMIPLEKFNVPRSLAQAVRKANFEVRINHDFRTTMTSCSVRREGGTWISPELIELYVELHELGFAHSVETWRDGKLVGGLYGVSMGAAFFGESMFYREPHASKAALWALVERLRDRKFMLLDTQAATRHLRMFGCIEVPSRAYLRLLHEAIRHERSFD